MLNSDGGRQGFFSKEQMQKITEATRQFEVAIRPEGFSGSLTDKLPDLPVSYSAVFLSWLRRMPRYHPRFKAQQAVSDDAAYIGINPSPTTAKDPSKLRLASQYVWAHHRQEALTFMDTLTAPPHLSVITVTELLAGVRGSKEHNQIEQLLSVYQIEDIDLEIASLAGDYVNQYGKSHHVDPLDAIIAATAKVRQLDLVTLNLKHFPMFPNLKRPY